MIRPDDWTPLRCCWAGGGDVGSEEGGSNFASGDVGGGWGGSFGGGFGGDTGGGQTSFTGSDAGGGGGSSFTGDTGGGGGCSFTGDTSGGGGGSSFTGDTSGGGSQYSSDGSYNYSYEGAPYSSSYDQGGYNFTGDLSSGNIGLDYLSGQTLNTDTYSGGGGWQGGGGFGNFTYGTTADQGTTSGPFGTATGREGGGPFGGWSTGFGGPPGDIAAQLSGNLTPGGGLIPGTTLADRGESEFPNALSGPQFDIGPPNQGQMPQGQGDNLPGWNISQTNDQPTDWGPPSITGQTLQDLANVVAEGRQTADPYAMDPAAIQAQELGRQGEGKPFGGYFMGGTSRGISAMDMEFNPFGMYQAPGAPPLQGTQGLNGPRSDAPSLIDMLGPAQARADLISTDLGRSDMPNVAQSYTPSTKGDPGAPTFAPTTQQANELNTQMLNAMRPDAQTINEAYQAALNSGRPGWNPAEQLAGRSVIDLPAQPFDQRTDTLASRFGENTNQAVPVAQSPYAQNFDSRFGDIPTTPPGWLNPSELTAGRTGQVDPSEWAQAQQLNVAPPVANMPWGSTPG